MSTPRPAAPLRVLVVDHSAVLRNNRVRWRRIAERYRDVAMTLLSPKMWVENNVNEPYQEDGGDPYAVVKGGVLFAGNAIRSFYLSGVVKALRRSNPEVIVLMEESFSLFALQVVILARLFARGARVTFYNLHINDYDFSMYRLGWMYRSIHRWVARRSDIGFCHDDTASSFLRASMFTGEVRTLFWGINEDLFRPLPREAVRRELGLDPNRTLILSAGRLLHDKGVQDLVTAFNALWLERPDLSLLIVGDGEYRRELERLAAGLPASSAIEFRSALPIERVPDLMAAADIFVLPSHTVWREQFGRVLVEAMLVGTTVVGSTSGAIPGIVEGRGYVFDAGNAESLRDALADALDDPAEAERRRQAARTWAMGRYSIDNFVEGIVDGLETLSGRELRSVAVEQVER